MPARFPIIHPKHQLGSLPCQWGAGRRPALQTRFPGRFGPGPVRTHLPARISQGAQGRTAPGQGVSPKPASPLTQVDTGPGRHQPGKGSQSLLLRTFLPLLEEEEVGGAGSAQRKLQDPAVPDAGSAGARGNRRRSAVGPGGARQGSVPPGRTGAWHVAPGARCAHTCRAGQGIGEGPGGWRGAWRWGRGSWREQGSCGVSRDVSRGSWTNAGGGGWVFPSPCQVGCAPG